MKQDPLKEQMNIAGARASGSPFQSHTLVLALPLSLAQLQKEAGHAVSCAMREHARFLFQAPEQFILWDFG
jgi:hypothetical protein